MARKRADELVLGQGLAPTRSQARALIMAGKISGPEKRRVEKAGELWPEETVFVLKNQTAYASRAGFKLAGALEDLKLSPAGLKALDVGASTGGFTDCLLKNGAASVVAVDVGRGLLDWRLRQDRRVTVVEGLNCRFLTADDVGRDFDLAVIDVSFISLALILPAAAPLMASNGRILAMVKPQFEVGRDKVGKGGVVRDPRLREEAVDRISALAPGLKPAFGEVGRAPSRLPGPEGNQEIFLLLAPWSEKRPDAGARP